VFRDYLTIFFASSIPALKIPIPDASQPSATGHTIDSKPSARWAKIQSHVLPDDLFDAGLVSVRAGLEDDEAVGFGAGEGLEEGGVGISGM